MNLHAIVRAMLELLRDTFKATAVKYLRAVDTPNGRSHQHEIGGLPKAGFGMLLGHDRDGEGIKYPCHFAWLLDDEEPVTCRGIATWYDTRAKNPKRGPEYRLYYRDNDVTAEFAEGALLLIALTFANELLLISSPAESACTRQLSAIFGFNTADLTPRPAKVDLTAQRLQLPLESMFRNLFGIELRPRSESDIEKVSRRFGNAFPLAKEFSAFVEEESAGDIDPIADPDGALIHLMTAEERYFRALEFVTARQSLLDAFAPSTSLDLNALTREQLDTFMSTSIGFQNRRKSRAGKAFENHIGFILKANDLPFDAQATTEARKRPDFLFPSEAAYRDGAYDASRLRMLGAKTTCKDRWRQIVTEADRIAQKHLITLEPAISADQTHEMELERVTLVVPAPILGTYDMSRQGSVLCTFSDFIAEVHGCLS